MSLVISYIVIVSGILFIGVVIGAILALRRPHWLAKLGIFEEERSNEQ